MANNLVSIFQTDPDAKPRPKQNFSNDTVGRFRAGRLVGKTPESLNEWRVTTGDPEVADLIAGLMGGEVEEWDTEKEDNLQVLTTSKSVEIIIDNSDAIDASMKKFGFSGLEHHCDGVKFLSDDDPTLVGTACGCPPMLEDRKARAKSGKGPKPSIDLTFALAARPEVGKFRFNSGGWSLVNVLHEVIEAIDTVGGRKEDGDGKVTDPGKPVRATLTIEHVAYTTKAGRDVSYNRPAVDVLGVYEVAQPADLAKAA